MGRASENELRSLTPLSLSLAECLRLDAASLRKTADPGSFEESVAQDVEKAVEALEFVARWAWTKRGPHSSPVELVNVIALHPAIKSIAQRWLASDPNASWADTSLREALASSNTKKE